MYYQQLGKLSNFDAEWKEEVESNVGIIIDMAACQSCVKMRF